MSAHSRTRVSTIALLCLLVAPGLAVAVGSGDRAPEWTGQDLQGRTVDFPGDAQGSPTVLLFWATWCPYCKAFIPQLESIQKDYSRYGVNVLAIDFKDQGDVAAYVRALGFPLHVVVHGDAIAKAYGVQYTPGIMVVDGNDTVVYRRASTDLPAGETLAKMWAGQVRKALDEAIGHRR